MCRTSFIIFVHSDVEGLVRAVTSQTWTKDVLRRQMPGDVGSLQWLEWLKMVLLCVITQFVLQFWALQTWPLFGRS